MRASTLSRHVFNMPSQTEPNPREEEEHSKPPPKEARQPFYAIYESNFDENIRMGANRAVDQTKKAYTYCKELASRKRTEKGDSDEPDDAKASDS